MKTIVLDPGHGGLDPGAVANGMYEKYINWDLANMIKNKLTAFTVDIQIVQPSCANPNSTANDELTIPPEEAKKLSTDFYLSLHVNAGGGTGFESYVQNDDPRSEEIRKPLHTQIMNFMKRYNIKDRGRKSSNFYVLRKCKEYGIPAVLVEILFIDNSKDILLLKNPLFLDGLANEIAYALSVIFDLQLK